MGSPPVSNDDLGGDESGNENLPNPAPLALALFGGVGLVYWYVLVLGAAAAANGLPVPGAVPMVPGWPVSDADLAPVLEDSYHFFYLSDLLQTPDAPAVSPPRLAVFNVVEAWIFAMLPALWCDSRRRLPRPVLLITWAALGINLTNAFLAPYLAITELRGIKSSNNNDSNSNNDNDSNNEAAVVAAPKNSIVASLFALVASSVVGYAIVGSVTATGAEWTEFVELAKTDRTYLAFCIDPVLFAVFQPLILARIKTTLEPLDYVPFVGLVAWLIGNEPDDSARE